jgi:PIN domain nuclease of toxin-antitoxin system
VTLLLDTHTFLWFCQDDPALSATARILLENPDHRKLVSLASCWEIAIKAGLGKLNLGESCESYIPNALTRCVFELLPISLAHITAVEALPRYHRDPFDRMLLAQAKVEGFPIVSGDIAFDDYGFTRLW